MGSSTTRATTPEQKKQKMVDFLSISVIKKNSDRKKKKKKQKQVLRFATKSSVRRTISITEMTEKEIQKMWIQQDEQHENEKRCQELVVRRRNSSNKTTTNNKENENNDEEEDSCRGLESYTKHGRQQKQMNRLEAMMVVLMEQEQQQQQQHRLNEEDEEEIAFQLYKEISAECQFQAELRAAQDRNEVEKDIKKEMKSNAAATNKYSSSSLSTASIVKTTVVP